MTVSHLLAECAATGITIVRDGDDLRVRAAHDADLTTVAPRIREHKLALHEALLQREIMALAHGSTETFDRSRFDALFAEWRTRYDLPWGQEEKQSCPD
jgi:hypothetical protein